MQKWKNDTSHVICSVCLYYVEEGLKGLEKNLQTGIKK